MLIPPYFVARPGLVLRRLRAQARRTCGWGPPTVTVQHVVGAPITVTRHDYVGWHVITRGFYDLCVSEALLRLTDAGDRVVDAGANVGALTAVLARAATTSGRVVCYEPHPRVVELLDANVQRWSHDRRMAPVEVRPAALGASSGAGILQQPTWTTDPSDAHLTAPGPPHERRWEVRVVALDEDADGVAILKLDIEGGEADALDGAKRLLSAGGLRDVVFEDFELSAHGFSPVAQVLAAHGYALFALGVRLRGLTCRPVGAGRRPATLSEPPSFLATLEPERALQRLHPRGWRLLAG